MKKKRIVVFPVWPSLELYLSPFCQTAERRKCSINITVFCLLYSLTSQELCSQQSGKANSFVDVVKHVHEGGEVYARMCMG